jgi:hypothetical protein
MKQVRAIASQNRFDLPAAYSVMLGVLTAEQVRDTLDTKPTVEPVAPEEAPSVEDLDLDPEFQPAIDEGTLSMAQAIQRGSREAFASKLIARHGLSRSLALDVADNRLPLIQAVRQRGPVEPIRADGPPAAPRTRKVALAAAVLVCLVFLAGAITLAIRIASSSADEQSSSFATSRLTIDSANILRDHLGRVIEISGNDPREVLFAYCDRVGDGASHTPLEISQSVPPQADLRLGVFRNTALGGSKFAIRIKRRGDTESWFAGGDGKPVPVIAAPDLPPDTPRVPVE